ncbi:preprotein translocase subunit YajC [Inquilinus sp. CAU 1745]|uniref:preprotein translocase subunit YajC n=1 Tax=Inquilinus sp. CAU 1745 TaxID=3140369 RepID=UPI00325C043E
MFVSEAFAQSAGGAAGGGNMIMQFLPLVLIFVVFYFLLIRPQQKKMKQHKEMLASVRRGDRVVTGGGIIGQVVKVGQDDELTLEISDGVRVKALRSTISLVLAKTEPAKARAAAEDDVEDSDADSVPPPPPAEERKGLNKFLPRK